MKTRTVDRPAFSVAGVASNTSLARQADDAPPLAARFFAPGFADSLVGRVDTTTTYAVHSHYDARTKSYRVTLGYEVAAGSDQPMGVDVIEVPAARYTVFTARGPQPQASIDAWKEITAWRGQPDLVRTGSVSFEVHDIGARGEAPEVEIYIPAIPSTATGA